MKPKPLGHYRNLKSGVVRLIHCRTTKNHTFYFYYAKGGAPTYILLDEWEKTQLSDFFNGS